MPDFNGMKFGGGSLTRFVALRPPTDWKTEILSGVTTFLTMAYILFVNPAILSAAGVPFQAAVTATALGAALMSICMGVVTNRPLALASGMGINAVLAFTVIGFQQARMPWQVGMAAIFVEGLLTLVLVLTGFREAVMEAIPVNLKRAIGAGIGLFITLIGLNQGGLIRSAPITLVSLGDFSQKYVWVTLAGLFITVILMAYKKSSAILVGMVSATIFAMILRLVVPSSAIISIPQFTTFFAPFQAAGPGGSMAIWQVFSPLVLTGVFGIMLTDFFDTMGTVVAIGERAGFADHEGKVEGLREILVVDAAAATVGGLFGASSITTYVESASGISVGGRTGWVAIIAGICFALSALFSPLIQLIGGGVFVPKAEIYKLFTAAGFQMTQGDAVVYPITAGALITVGFMMMGVLRKIDWDDFSEAFPAFLILIGIPLTYNISYGIGLGMITHTVIRFARGQAVKPLMAVISIAFLVAFIVAR